MIMLEVSNWNEKHLLSHHWEGIHCYLSVVWYMLLSLCGLIHCNLSVGICCSVWPGFHSHRSCSADGTRQLSLKWLFQQHSTETIRLLSEEWPCGTAGSWSGTWPFSSSLPQLPKQLEGLEVPQSQLIKTTAAWGASLTNRQQHGSLSPDPQLILSVLFWTLAQHQTR